MIMITAVGLAPVQWNRNKFLINEKTKTKTKTKQNNKKPSGCVTSINVSNIGDAEKPEFFFYMCELICYLMVTSSDDLLLGNKGLTAAR